MRATLQRSKSLLLSCIVSIFASILLSGLLSLLRTELVFAGFPMAGALGGSVAGYYGRRLRMLQGAMAGLVAGGVELSFLMRDGAGFLPTWALAGLVALNTIAGMLGARVGQAVQRERILLDDEQPPAHVEHDVEHDVEQVGTIER